MDRIFLTQEIGSLAKPNWRVKKIAGTPLSEKDFAELEKWSKELGLESKEVHELLKAELTPQNKARLLELSSLHAVRLLEKAGLDIIYNGEQFRVEMYQEPVQQIEGFRFYGEVRSFDNKYYKKAAVVAPPRLKLPYHLGEFQIVKRQATRPLKVPVTGAYTLADWSFNEHYMRKWNGNGSVREAEFNAKREFTIELARNVLRPCIEALVDAGAGMIQIDEPAAGTKPHEVAILVEAFNESVRGIDCKFLVHNCFSNYRYLFPAVFEMKKCRQFTLEFANRDHADRTGYEDISLFREHNDGRELGLGVLNVHSDVVESAELVRDRILGVARFLNQPELIYVNPDCGLRTRSWDAAYRKLCNMVKGAALARESLGG